MARTKGSKNKRSVGVPGELKARLNGATGYEVLVEYYQMTVDDLAKLLRSKAGRAAVAIKLEAAKAAIPYEMSKMPVKVEVNDEELPTVVIYRDRNSKSNQQLIDKSQAVDVVSSNEKSSNEAQVIEKIEVNR